MSPSGHDTKKQLDYMERDKIILVGNPNVGKSVIFGLLTGKYVTVSNYPGTTVEVSRAFSRFGGKKKYLVIDTPGTNSLIPQSEDERVTRDILLDENAQMVVQVADSKNLRRGLSISIQLSEMEIPFVLDINMIDEAMSRGINVDTKKLGQILGTEVIPTVATRREGISGIIKGISNPAKPKITVDYGDKLESGIKQIQGLFPEKISRLIAIMLLEGEHGIDEWSSIRYGKEAIERVSAIRSSIQSMSPTPLSYLINKRRMAKVDEIMKEVQTKDERARDHNIAQTFGRLSMHPVWGIPILLAVLYITYKIVGEFGAGTCVDFMENIVFGEYINPFLTRVVHSVTDNTLIRDFLIGEYGIFTMAFTYAIAIVLPIVGFFFLIFGLMEDSGYMPRLAIMVNRIFRIIGLNGTAVLPMVLGLGCATMATLTARILPSKKERIIITLLLALAVPCSAQLGVIFGGTSTISPWATIIWATVIIFVILVVGFFSSIVIPGKKSDFILETPPIRIPKVSNIIIKTFARIEWYLKEAVPLFMLGTIILFTLDKLGALTLIQDLAAPVVVNLLGLPKDIAGAFVMGFLRRDYAAVLVVKGGNLDPIQMLVALVTITLFVPCIANMLIMIKERGIRTASLIVSFIFVFAFLFGGLFNLLLRALKVSL
ncbi:MAG: ferrous iron transport protein B [Deltaproteobacteria bacterium]|nr:ferrous iron transport protein B [Deltaproteobacteria bacterium]